MSTASKKPLYAAIDAGTSAIKCIALDPQRPRDVRLIGSIETAVVRPAPGHAEIDLATVFDAVLQLIERLLRLAETEGYEVKTIGLTGHITSAICIDAAGTPLPPCAIWQDERSAAEADELFRHPAAELEQMLGIMLPRGVQWAGPKVRWLARHQPELLGRTWKILQVKDYLFFHLTRLAYSDARSFQGLANIITKRFTPEALQWCGISHDILPDLREPTEIFAMDESWRQRFSFYTSPLPCIGIGTADMTAAFLGCALKENEGVLLANTAEILGFAIAAENREPTPRAVVRVPYRPPLDLIYASTTNGGSSVSWFQQVFGPCDLAQITDQAAQIVPGSDGLIFLPYLMGERAPIWDANVSGALVGLRVIHTCAHIFRAILEGCAFSKRHVMESACPQQYGGVKHLKICGGTAKSALWNQIRASVLDRPLSVSAHQEMSSLGALLLAAVSLEPKLIDALSDSGSRPIVQPIPQWTEIYAKMFPHYVALSSELRNSGRV